MSRPARVPVFCTWVLMLPAVMIFALMWARAPSRNPDIGGVDVTGLTSDRSSTRIPGVEFVCRVLGGKTTCSTNVGGQQLSIAFTHPFASYCSARFAGIELACDGTLNYAPQLKPFVSVRVPQLSTPRPYTLGTAEIFMHRIDSLLYRAWPVGALFSAVIAAVVATLAFARRLQPPRPDRLGVRISLLSCVGLVFLCISVLGAVIGVLVLGYED